MANVVYFFEELEFGHMEQLVTYEGVDGPMLLHLMRADALEIIGFTKVQALEIKGRILSLMALTKVADGTRGHL